MLFKNAVNGKKSKKKIGHRSMGGMRDEHQLQSLSNIPLPHR
jgi:hypothetical protein